MSETWFEDIALAESPFATEVEAPPGAWPSETAGLPPTWPEDEVPFAEVEEQAPRPGLSASRLEWPGGPAGGLAFMRKVYDKHVEWHKAKGETFVADLARKRLDRVEGPHRARRDAAAAARALLAEAKVALAAAGLADRERIGVISGYRPASRQFDIWQGKGRKGKGGFPYYYQQLLKENRLHPGDYGPAAVAAMTTRMAKCIAAPGYSNHQDGLAIDFGAGAVGGDKLRFILPKGNGQWFHRWLCDNAARHRFHEYAGEPWHWVYRPAELVIDRVPLLAKHRGRGPDLILRWNVFSVPEEIDVVVHLHGNSVPGMRLEDDIEPVSGLDLAPVGVAAWQGRSRPTLTVLPRGKDTGEKQGPGSRQNKYRFPSLTTSNGVPDLVIFSLERFAAKLGGTPPRVGRLILTAHSAGGWSLLQILRHRDKVDPHQVHVFDALYQQPTELVTWAEGRIDRDRKALAGLGTAAAREYMTTRGGALRVFYWVKIAKTKENSGIVHEQLAEKLDPGMERWYRVEGSTCDHFEIPTNYGWRMLTDASADVPDAHPPPAKRPEVGLESFDEWEEPEWTATEDLEEEDLEEEDLELEEEEELEEFEELEVEEGDLEEEELEEEEGFLTHASEEALDEGSAESQELFEAEEFARHALYEVSLDEDEIELGFAAEESPAEAPSSRPRNLTASQVRKAWRAYAGAKHRMVPLRLFGRWNPPVNPLTVDAWRALERALGASNYDVHRAWVFVDRSIAGTQTRSLHAYGLAIDIDHAKPTCNVNRATPTHRKVRFSSAATKEGRCQDVRDRKADTSFTPDQVAAVEAIRTVDGHQVFVWGGRWQNIKDTMHFEINVTPDELARGLQPDSVSRPPSAGPGEEAEEIPYEALGGFEPELEEPGLAEADREHQAPKSKNPYGNVAVSTGEFGKALRRFAKDYAVTDAVLWMLKQSPTYKSIVKTLDTEYLDFNRYMSETGSWPQDNHGVFTKGPHTGRRLIYFQSSAHGSYFVPHEDPDNRLSSDIIWLERPPNTADPTAAANFSLETKGIWVERIAHESVHAHRRVLGKRRPGKTAQEQIRAAIDDEIATRTTERQIIDEVGKKVPKFAKYQPTTGSLERWAVERDLFPGEKRRTYLEQFVLGELLASARTAIDEPAIEKYGQIVNGITLGSPPYSGFLTLNPHFVHPRRGRMPIFTLMYPRVLLALRVIDARWRSVKDLDPPDTVIEKMHQEHAKAFFNNLATYTKLP